MYYNILITKRTRLSNSQIYFWNKTLHVSDSSSVHQQEFFTVHTTMVYVMHARKLSANLYDIYHCCVYSEKLMITETCRIIFQK